MSDDPIDFSSLDPWGDPRQFEHRVQAVMTGLPTMGIKLLPQPDFLTSLVRWGRVAVVVASMIAVCIWVPHLTRGLRSGTSRAQPTESSDAVRSLSTWADRGGVPSDVDPLLALSETADAE